MPTKREVFQENMADVDFPLLNFSELIKKNQKNITPQEKLNQL